MLDWLFVESCVVELTKSLRRMPSVSGPRPLLCRLLALGCLTPHRIFPLILNNKTMSAMTFPCLLMLLLLVFTNQAFEFVLGCGHVER